MQKEITHNGEDKMNLGELTPEQLDVTPEQIRCCVREMPWEALKYYEDELFKEQQKQNIARRTQND